MPKTTSNSSAAASKKPRASKKKAPKTIRPKKKAKTILVDVIEDEPLEDVSTWREELVKKTSPRSPAREKLSRLDEDLGEIDQQKKFYSQLAAEIKKPKESREDEPLLAPQRRVGLYRRQVIRYVALVVLIAAAVFYFSYSKLTVTLNLKGESLNNNLLLKVSNAAEPATSTPLESVTPEETLAARTISPELEASFDPREEIPGTIKTVEVEVSEEYEASGETFLGDDIKGEVRIINNYSKSQALVATTRLLTSDGKLFRIVEAVNVPAGGEVKVAVYADKASADMAVGPTSFTIPGLWAGLQDKIYARSDAPFTFTKRVKKHVNANDLERAAKDINDRLLEAAKAKAQASLGDNWLYQVEGAPEITIDAKIGEAKDRFTARAKGRIVAVSFDKQQVADLAQAKLNLVIPAGKELADFQAEQIAYTFENYDKENGTATIKASFSGTMIHKKDSTIIDPRQLVNLTAEQIGTYLRDKPEIREYRLDFSPSFIKKAPSLADRIKIEVNKN